MTNRSCQLSDVEHLRLYFNALRLEMRKSSDGAFMLLAPGTQTAFKGTSEQFNSFNSFRGRNDINTTAGKQI